MVMHMMKFHSKLFILLLMNVTLHAQDTGIFTQDLKTTMAITQVTDKGVLNQDVSSINSSETQVTDPSVLNQDVSSMNSSETETLSTDYRTSSELNMEWDNNVFNFTRLASNTHTNEFLIDTSGCKVKNIDEFNKSTLPHLMNLPPFQCQNKDIVGFDLVYRIEFTLFINETIRENILDHFKVTNNSDFHCCVHYFKRYSNEESDDNIRTEDCIKFSNHFDIKEEFMSIACYINPGENAIYQNNEFVVMRKSAVEARIRAQEESERAHGIVCPNRLSVLIVGMDSTSRLNSRRFLQRTHLQLQKMGAIEFMGYNRVGQNTYPNIGTALMMGRDRVEVDKSGCMKSDPNGFMDQCHTLFDHFGAIGYRTAFVENMNYYGLYNYLGKGFQRQPADYYGRTFFKGMLDEAADERDCYRSGNRVSNDEAVHQWATEFQKEFTNQSHFGYFWISIFTHACLNCLQHVDDFLPGLLHRMSEDGENLLNTTLLVLMSDHGIRFGEASYTDIGQLEMNLPFMGLVFPKWFKELYSNEMKEMEENARNRLTTPYDLHATLRDIANCRFSRADGDGSPKPPVNLLPQSPQAISLFDPVPEQRTCADAGIPTTYCSCTVESESLPRTGWQARILGQLIVDTLNTLITDVVDYCAKIYLDNVEKLTSTRFAENDTSYNIVVNTKPGNALFKSTVYYTESNKSFVIDPDIIRMNLYGNNSYCIKDKDQPKLMPICFCS